MTAVVINPVKCLLLIPIELMAWQKHSQQWISHGQLLWKGKAYLVITEITMPTCCRALNVPYRATPQGKNYHITAYFAVGLNVSQEDEEAHPGHPRSWWHSKEKYEFAMPQSDAL